LTSVACFLHIVNIFILVFINSSFFGVSSVDSLRKMW
jgi:hypothetical protein